MTSVLALLLLLAALTLAACGGSNNTAESSPAAGQQATPLPPPSVPGTIAFTRVTKVHGEPYGDIYTIRSDGTGLTRLAGSADDEDNAGWSPDGSEIAYNRFLGQEKGAEDATVWVMAADGSGQRRITRKGIAGYAPVWSPDGTQIAFSKVEEVDHRYAGYDLAVMNADGSGLQQVTEVTADTLARPNPIDAFPAWAPGGRIFFDKVDQGQIWAVNPDGSGATVVTSGPSEFSLSPDGKWLVIYEGGKDCLGLMPATGQGTEIVLVDKVSRYIPDAPAVAPSWSSDGKTIAFAASSADDWGGSALYIVNADGSGLRKVPNTGKVLDPAWRPQ